MKKIYHVNTDQNKCGLEILISDEVDFREKILLEKRDNYVTIKWSTHKEDVTNSFRIIIITKLGNSGT